MEKIKKFWKELSIFGIIIVVFLGLFVYRRIICTTIWEQLKSALVEK